MGRAAKAFVRGSQGFARANTTTMLSYVLENEDPGVAESPHALGLAVCAFGHE